jgi:hypothetical protein
MRIDKIGSIDNVRHRENSGLRAPVDFNVWPTPTKAGACLDVGSQG